MLGTDVSMLRRVGRLRTLCNHGIGLAACSTLGVVVTSSHADNSLSVWDADPTCSKRHAGLRLVCTLGGEGSPDAIRFKFNDDDVVSGYLAFTPFDIRVYMRPLLLVTDVGADAVHVIDVVERTHKGYLAAPMSIAKPRGVAVSLTAPLAGVSAYDALSGRIEGLITLYQGRYPSWQVTRVIRGLGDNQLQIPLGLRFARDDLTIWVADVGHVRAFRVQDGEFQQNMVEGLRPCDV